MYIGITKNRNCNNFNIFDGLIHFRIFDSTSMTSSGEGSQSTSFENLNKPVKQFEKSVDCLQFVIHINGKFHQYFSFSIYLSIPTRLLPITWDYNWRCSIIGYLLNIIVSYDLLRKNIDLNWITVEQPGFVPRSPGPKVATVPLC